MKLAAYGINENLDFGKIKPPVDDVEKHGISRAAAEHFKSIGV